MSTINVTVKSTKTEVLEYNIRGLKADLDVLLENVLNRDSVSITYSIEDIRSISQHLLKGAEFLANQFAMEDES